MKHTTVHNKEGFMPKQIDLALLHGAAYHFAFISRSRHEIADNLGLSQRTITRYAAHPEWDNTLNLYGYTGERSFIPKKRRDTITENPTYKKAKQVYLTFIADGIPKHKLASLTAEAVGEKPAKIRDWKRKYNWTDN